MKRRLRHLFAALFLCLTLGGTAVAALPSIIEEKDILPYLERMISWRRQVMGLEAAPELPRQLIIKNSLRGHTQKTLETSFNVARTLADMLPPAPPKPPEKDAGANDTEDKNAGIGLKRAILVAELQVEQMQKNLARATAGNRMRLAGELKLAQEHLALLNEIAQTMGVPDKGSDTLPYKISQLNATLTEMDEQAKAAGDAAPAAPAAVPDSGILGKATKIWTYLQAKSRVKAALDDTNKLIADNRDRSQTIRAAVKSIIEEGHSLGAKPEAGAKPQSYDELITEMRQLAKIAVALSQTNKALALCVSDLQEWSDLLTQHIKDLMGNLIFRISMLVLAIGIALGLDFLAKKATRRYITDRRRREHLRMLRKVVFAITVGIILLLGFFTDLGSLATFAGLLTAGIAFAMKDVILSTMAYFQFFSTGDIRAGDSVTVAGVNGKITHIGMLRFYMMEMEKADVGFLPTGRMVGFANSVLFQPSPLFRQTPGVNFVWNNIEIHLSPNIDHELAYPKLNALVQKIYAKQQEFIIHNEEALQKISPFKLEVSKPQTYFRFTSTGIVFVIRYAVEREQAQSFHFQMTSELLANMRRDPELKALHITGVTSAAT